jgi:hypothetical protein
MKLRRSMTALTGAAVLLLGGVTAAQAQDDSADDPSGGLYGEGDPAYDGVLRQSLTLLALHGSGQAPPEAAVEWLTGQQCADGSYTAFRADASAPCADDEPRDTNATGIAIQALAALGGQDAAVDAGAGWLREVQNEDGGWPYAPGDATDANSTALVIGGLAAAGEDTAAGIDALNALQLGCDADEAARGGYAWQDDPDAGLLVNDTATVDAVLAAHGSGILVEPAGDSGTPQVPACESPDQELSAEESAAAGAGYLANQLAANDGHLISAFAEGEPDFGATSKAVPALAAGGHGESLSAPLTWLETNHTDWEGYDANPGALAQLALAAHAGGADPTDFGGTDLITGLLALGPEPDAEDTGDTGETGDDTAGETDGETGDDAAEDEDSSIAWLLWVLGIGLLAGIGIGVLVSLRRRRANAAATDAADTADTADAADTGKGQD